MRLKEVFEKSVQFFKDKKFDSARLDAELLISEALKIDRLQIYLKYEQPLSDVEVSNCRDFVRRRGLGEPVAYILGQKGFYGETFSVGKGVLIPRPETELLVEEAVKFIVANNLEKPKILDLGAGTGCIGFSILKQCPEATLVSLEKSSEAYEHLQSNQRSLGLIERSEILLLDVLQYKIEPNTFEVVVANPPYIDSNDVEVEINVKKFEPETALFAKDKGLADLMEWSSRFALALKTPGIMLFEMGSRQGPQMQRHFEELKSFSKVEILKDLSGLDRAIKGLNNNSSS